MKMAGKAQPAANFLCDPGLPPPPRPPQRQGHSLGSHVQLTELTGISSGPHKFLELGGKGMDVSFYS